MSAHAVTHVLEATSRLSDGPTPKAIRSTGLVPAVVYGNVKENLHITVDNKIFRKLYMEIGSSSLVNLKVDGKAIKVLVQDVQVGVVRNEVVHVDFFAVNMKEKLTTEVPIVFTGVSAAVEELDGTFVAVKDELEVECLPDNLPSEISIDISVLATFDDAIRIKDVVLPEGVTLLGDPEEMIASITEPISEAELAELDEAPAAAHETEFETEEGTTPSDEAKGS
jgi:large subunit ribosomal protein L25